MRRKLVLFAAFLTAIASAASAQPADDWRVSTGVGVVAGPAYEGSDKYKVTPLPLLDIVWRDRVFLGVEQGLGFWAFRQDGFRLGAALGYERGRKESDDRDNLDGIGNVDAAAQARLLARYETGPFRFDAAVARALGGSDGTTVKLGAGMRVRVAEKFTLIPGAAVVWADDDYMKSYFGVDAVQAAASLARLGSASAKTRFDARAGIKNFDLGVTGIYALTPNWSLTGRAGVSILTGDAADSPLSKRDVAPMGLLGASYRW